MGFIQEMEGLFNTQTSINTIHCIYNIKKQNHMIIPIDKEKTFDKTQHIS